MTRESSSHRLGAALLFVASCAITLGLIEAGLRLVGFEFELLPKVQFGWPDPTTLDLYASDPDLLWVPKGYRETLESARRSHPAVVFMGDSCTEFGRYPAYTLERLATVRPELASGVALGVGGWSSEQGLAQLHRDVLPLLPQVVTLYFGWNDHWVALGPPDPEIRRVSGWMRMAAHCRLLQLVGKAWMASSARGSERPNRVELSRYHSNLRAMIRQSQGAGVRVVAITAPSNHLPGREPEYLKERHLRRLGDLVPLHEAYVEATRRAAQEGGAALCDAAQAFRLLPPPADQYFRRDGIHLTRAGDEALADMLSACIESALNRPLDLAQPPR